MTTIDGFDIGRETIEDYIESDRKLGRQRVLLGVSSAEYETGKTAGLEKARQLLGLLRQEQVEIQRLYNREPK